MMKRTIQTVFLVFAFITSVAQSRQIIDSLRHELTVANHDTSRVMILSKLCLNTAFEQPDSALMYGYQGLALARQINFPRGEVRVLDRLILAYGNLGNIAKGLQLNLEALKIANEYKLIADKGNLLMQLGEIYFDSKEYAKALPLLRESVVIRDSLNDVDFSLATQNIIAEIYLSMNQPDSALFYCQAAYDKSVVRKVWWVTYRILFTLGKIYQMKGSHELALNYFRQSLAINFDSTAVADINYAIAKLYKQIGKPDSSIYYAKKSLQAAREGGFYLRIIKSSTFLSEMYEQRDIAEAFKYNKLALTTRDSLYQMNRAISFESITNFDERERQYEIDTAKASYRNQVRQYVLLSGLGVILLIAIILYRNYLKEKKSKRILNEKNKEIEITLSNLKATQSQLIQSEKMASLGELTAGIAHEIQNPLNFVNNFSEVSNELIDEMKDEFKKGEIEEGFAIADDIKQNLEKINHHGKRADGIVKSMLEHSRTSTGVKEPTDINKLADEYLRLSYHGLRAKDKNFNAEMKTDFDESIGKINIVGQDIGRVLLNLYNNAFYACAERSRNTVNQQKSKNSILYEPTVWVSTKKEGDRVTITVKDNGEGIPEKIKEKIFQPFFTTKPTGSGTGLGLSLSYDIVKAHRGEMRVESKEKEGAEFIIKLPLT